MKRWLLLVALAACLAACHRSAATCKDVGPVVTAWGDEQIAAEKLSGDAAAKRQRLFAVTAELFPHVCESDKWSGDAIDCLVAAKTEEDAQKCPLTKDQRDSMQKALMDALGKK